MRRTHLLHVWRSALFCSPWPTTKRDISYCHEMTLFQVYEKHTHTDKIGRRDVLKWVIHQSELLFWPTWLCSDKCTNLETRVSALAAETFTRKQPWRVELVWRWDTILLGILWLFLTNSIIKLLIFEILGWRAQKSETALSRGVKN